MDMDFLNRLQTSAAPGQIPLSTCGETRKQNSPQSVPAETRNLIAELGLRYRPSAAADLEAHAALLALLARDLADSSPDLLRHAIRQWARQSKFMPKAAELIELMAAEADRRRPRPGPLPPARLTAAVEAPIEVIPPAEIRSMTRPFLDIGLSKGWLTQEQIDAAFQGDQR